MIIDCPRLAARCLLRGLIPLILSLLLCAVSLLPAVAQADLPDETGFGELSFVDQIGAPVRAVVVRAPYAYLAEGRYLTILDVADPVLPVVVQRMLMPETVQDLALAGNYVYVADGASGLRVVDVRDPAEAREVYAYTDQKESKFIYLVAGDGYLYVVDDAFGIERVTPRFGKKLLTFDLAQAATPRLVTVSDLGSVVDSSFFGVAGLTVAGRYLYVPAGNYGGASIILDIVNPAEPAFAGTINTRGSALALAVDGDYLYAATGPWGLQIYPRTPDAPPGEVGFYDDDRQTARSDANSVAIQGRYAYVLAERASSTELRMVDVYNPAAPYFFDAISLPGSLAGINYSRAIVLDGTVSNEATAYVANGYGGLRILDLWSRRELGSYDPVGAGYRVAVNGTYVYLLSWSGAYSQGSTLYMLDATDPTRPVVRGSVALPDEIEQMVTVDNAIYLTNWRSAPRIVDASDPDHPRMEGRLGSEEGLAVVGPLAAHGQYGYLTGARDDGFGKLLAFDLKQPLAPKVVGQFAPSPASSGIYAAGDTLYVSTDGELWMVDVSNPASPRPLSANVENSLSTDTLLGHGRYLYHIQGGDYAYSGVLNVFDLVEPTAPMLLSSLPLFGGNAALAGDYLYVTGPNGTQVIDVSDPAAPAEVVANPAQGRGISVLGETVYVVGLDGLTLLRFRPARTVSIPASGGELAAGSTTVTFPAGAFAETAQVTITQRANLDIMLDSAEQAPLDQIQLTAVYSDTGAPAEPQAAYTLVFQYEDGEIGALREETLALYTWDGTAWVAAPSSRVEVDANTLTATSTQLGRWLIAGESWRGYLPVVQN